MDRTAVIFILLITALALSGIIPTFQRNPGPVENNNDTEMARVTFDGGLVIDCELASTESERVRGLMDRQELDMNRGMLFIHDPAETVTIWMKDTYIDLDIVFISEESTVTGVVEADAGAGKTDSDLELYTSKSDVMYVLEMNQGLAQRHGIRVGSTVEIVY